MATTYLDVTNELLRELNEIPLTAATFSDAVGVQQHIKDCVNRAYMDICNEEAEWPFLANGLSGDIDPFLGNTSFETVKGTRWYTLKPDSTGHATDFRKIDWDTFYLTNIGVAGVTKDYESHNLKFTTLEEWKDFYRTSENVDDASDQIHGLPTRVIRSPDGRQLGLSPIPDKAYKIYYTAFIQPLKLTTYDQPFLFPDVYVPVLMARARYYCWQFKENPQAASFAMEDYRKGLDFMRSNLIEPTPSYFKDDRVRFY